VIGSKDSNFVIEELPGSSMASLTCPDSASTVARVPRVAKVSWWSGLARISCQEDLLLNSRGIELPRLN